MTKNLRVPKQSGTNAERIINSAISQVHDAGGGTVTLDPGAFIISNPVYMKSGVTLQGTKPEDGHVNVSEIRLKSQVAINSPSSKFYIPVSKRFPSSWQNAPAMIMSQGASDITIRYLSIDPDNASYWYGSGKNSSYISRGRGYLDCAIISGGTNISCYNLTLNGGTKTGFGDGLHFLQCYGRINLYNITISPAQGHDGLFLQACVGTIKIHNNTIYANTNSAMRMQDCSEVEIYENTCLGGSTDGPGIQIDHNYVSRNGRYLPCHVDIHDNYIGSMYGPGISLTALAESTTSNHIVKIHNNIVTDCSRGGDVKMYSCGIHIGGGCKNVSVYDNTIDSNWGNGISLITYGGPGSSQYIGKSRNCVIKLYNNQITNNKPHYKWKNSVGQGYGIANYLDHSNSVFEIYNNNVWGNSKGTRYNNPVSSGNMSEDPRYVDRANHDYHLKSKYGSYHNSSHSYVKDSVNSSSIRFGHGTEIGRYNGDEQRSLQSESDKPDEPDNPDNPEVLAAAFSATPRSGRAPLVVRYTDESTGNPTSWHWDFQNNTESDAKNVSVRYNFAGKYSATLRVSDGKSTDTETKTDYIVVTEPLPTVEVPDASFKADVRSGQVPLTVNFTDLSTNNPTDWEWTFGDDSTSSSKNPTHTYDEPGSYRVKLTASNSAGSDSSVKVGYIRALPFAPYVKPAYDTRIEEANPTKSFPDPVFIGIGDRSTGRYRSLLWFNLDDYIGKKISKAVLRLYWHYPSDPRKKDTILEVYRPTAIWDPQNVNWRSNRPTRIWKYKGGDWSDATHTYQGNRPYGTLTFDKDQAATKQYYEIDVTELVKYYLNGTYRNYGFFIKAKYENGDYIAFYSLECGSDLATPKLVITEEVPKPVKQILYVASDADSGDFLCDGKDDNIQINQALKQVYDNPDLYSGIYLKGPFTYTINETLLVGGDCTLSGDPTAIVKLKDDCLWPADKPMIAERAGNTANVEVNGFEIDGNRSNQHNSSGSSIVSGKGFHDIIHFTDVDTISVHDMYFTNNHGDGLKTDNCSYITFYNNTIYLPGHDGLYVSNGTDVEAYNNTITCRTDSGIRLYNTNRVKVHDNKITSLSSGNAGIHIQKYGTFVMDDIEICDNEIYRTSVSGILCSSASSYKASTTMLHIHHNKIYDAGIKNSTHCGGIIFNGFNALIENNVIDGCSKSGIYFKNVYSEVPVISGTLEVTVRNNIVSNTKDGYGVIKNSTAANTSVTFQNNCLYNNEYGTVKDLAVPTGSTANITSDPLFADRTNHDYHLKSKAGRYNPGTGKWVIDTVKSPCIDAGYSLSEWENEPGANGGRINIGLYGNTIYASMSGDLPVAINKPPVLAEISNKTVEITHTLAFDLDATDPENDVLTFTASGLPTGATLDPETGSFTWTPTASQEGTYTVTFTVSDGDLSDSQTIKIGVIKQIVLSFTDGKMHECRIRQSTPTKVLSTSPYLDVGGKSDTGVHRSLIEIDMTEYMGTNVTSALLSLHWFMPDGQERANNTVLDVYSPLPWDILFVSWNMRTEAATWTQPGGDWIDKNKTLHGSVPFASLTLNADTVPVNGYLTFDVTELVQQYANGTLPNSGFFIKARDEVNNYVGFYSSRMGIEGLKPKLEVQYTS